MRRRPPVPQAIDPASGFKVPLSELQKQWDGEMVSRRFIDKRNPQDFVRGVKDDPSLPFARPETTDAFAALPLVLEAGGYIYTESAAGTLVYDEGLRAESTL